MITIPTCELIGCLADVLPHISDKDSPTGGVKIEWDGEVLHFTVYDVYSAVTVHWLPGEGAESELGESDEQVDVPNWGGDDLPWRTFIWLAQAKEIVKVFRLPSKLAFTPVILKCSPTGDRITVEREDGPRVGRHLQVPADPDMLPRIPDVRAIAYAEDREDPGARDSLPVFSPARLAAFGVGRPLGVLRLDLSGDDETPVGVTMGRRLAGYVYRSRAKNVRPYNLLRDGSGVVTS